MSLETSIDNLANAILALTSKLGTAPVVQTPTITTTGPITPNADDVAKAAIAAEKAEAAAKKSAAAEKAKADKAEIDKATAAKAAAEKAPADAVAAAASTKVETPAGEVSVEQIRAVATDLITKDKRDAVVAVWAKYGVTKIKELKPKDYTNVLADLKAID